MLPNDRLKRLLQLSLLKLSVLLVLAAVTVLAPEAANARQLQSHPNSPFAQAGAQRGSHLRNSVAKLGRSFRARPSTNRVAPIESTNFVIYADDELLARKVSREAERFRKELSIEWLGREIPTWRHKCPIKVEIAPNAGGETSFAFVTDNTGRGEPIDWNMKIYGPPDRLLDAVLPHEVTHTIFATHFGQPLPRWADEGACTTVEHESERRKNHRMLLEFLTSQPSRGIPFNRMFTMRNYPHDILPLYAQGYSLARFLIAKQGQRHFVDYVGKGLENEGRAHPLKAWDEATREFYQYKNLSELQVDWLAWVKNGSKESDQRPRPDMLEALAKSQPKFDGGANTDVVNKDDDVFKASFVEVVPQREGEIVFSADKPKENLAPDRAQELADSPMVSSRTDSRSTNSWYVREMNRNETGTQLDSEKPSVYTGRIASKNAWRNQARKVPSNDSSVDDDDSPAEHDSRIPESLFRPPTIWR